MASLTSGTSGALKGRIAVPGDKSISHRALILGALAVGRTRIEGLLEADDVLRTAAAIKALGAEARRGPGAVWTVEGVGTGGLAEPADILDFGNSGTGARLMLGAVATHPMTAIFTGDASLRRRPMGRVAEPLQRMGARIEARGGGLLPLTITGAADPMPLAYTLPVASAQVKSAILLAGLNAPGETSVTETLATRDHTERLLRHFGGALDVVTLTSGHRHIALKGEQELKGADLVVPGDPSAAAFPLVAALLLPGSEIVIERVGMNPLRTGLFATLREMGARIETADERIEGGEPVADLAVRAGTLRGVEVPAERAPSMIDEYPILAVAAAFAEGRTVMHGLGELRLKESDRLAAIVEGLAACGASAAIAGDTLTVEGKGWPRGGGTIATRLDHRIAMAFLVLGLGAERPVAIDDGEPIKTSFPGFVALMNRLGASIKERPA